VAELHDLADAVGSTWMVTADPMSSPPEKLRFGAGFLGTLVNEVFEYGMLGLR
jgi:hypothetical protein